MPPDAVTDTLFADPTPLHDVEYEYRVLVRAAGRELFSNTQKVRLVLPSVQTQAPVMESSTASATIQWTPYVGPRFQAYRVHRRLGLESVLVGEITSQSQSTLADSGLQGNAEYFYRVDVITTQDETIQGAEISDRFHPVVQSWPLDVGDNEYVRLYRETDDRIAVLIAGRSQVRWLEYDLAGGLLEEQVILTTPALNLEPPSVTTARSSDGIRLLSVASANNLRYFINSDPAPEAPFTALLRFDADWQPVWLEDVSLEGSALSARQIAIF